LVDSSYKKEKVDIINEIDKIVNENMDKISEKKLKIIKKYKNKNYTVILNKEHLNICI